LRSYSDWGWQVRKDTTGKGREKRGVGDQRGVLTSGKIQKERKGSIKKWGYQIFNIDSRNETGERKT